MSFYVGVPLLLAIAVFPILVGTFFVEVSPAKQVVEVKIDEVRVLAEVVSDPMSRARGLSGRKELPQNGGMLFLFPEAGLHSFWMKEMRFPLDLFWIRKGRVVDIEENVMPPARGERKTSLPTFTPDVPATAVLEVNAGFAAKHRIKVGSKVTVVTSRSLPESAALIFSAPLGEEAALSPDNIGSNGTFFTEFLSGNGDYDLYRVSYSVGDEPVYANLSVPKGISLERKVPAIVFLGSDSFDADAFFRHKEYVAVTFPDANETGTRAIISGLLRVFKDDSFNLFDSGRIGIWSYGQEAGEILDIASRIQDIRAVVLVSSAGGAEPHSFPAVSVVPVQMHVKGSILATSTGGLSGREVFLYRAEDFGKKTWQRLVLERSLGFFTTFLR